MAGKRSNEPIFWSLFGAGGTLAAFLTPIMILVTGILVPLGVLGDKALSYEQMHAFASNWLGKLILLAVISLPLWHSVHRIFHGLHDLGIHGNRNLYKLICYGAAGLGSVVALVVIVAI